MLRVKKHLRGYQPLCYVEGGILLAKRAKIFKSDLELADVDYLCKFPQTFKEKMLSLFRISSRIFRLDVRFALNVDNLYILMVCGDKIWRLDLITHHVSLDFVIPNSRTALYLSIIRCVNGGAGKIVFGDYFNNPDKRPARIWATDISETSSWEVAHEFQAGEINHIHNVISSDIDNKCYILTGDFGDGAAIWEADVKFEAVSPLVIGSQKYRACWAIVENEGLAYATDTQLEFNSFCNLKNRQVISSELIEGSSIYFGRNSGGYYFSTTVEPDEPSGNFVRDVFSYKLGKGILSSRSKIYSVGKDGKIQEEFIARKDFLPTRLAQFGSFTFPSGVFGGGNIIVFGVALARYDGCCLLLEHVH